METVILESMDGRLEGALCGANALLLLRELTQEILGQGQDPASVLALFEQTRRRLRNEGREAEKDVLMEAMDLLVGWCSPHMRLADPGH
jgi:hypothetical protein